MNAEIITIGDEILIGQTIDTNSAWLGENLNLLGIDVSRIITISDSEEAIVSALKESFGRCSLVIITGGLGPTKDDITKQTLAKFFDTRLVVHQETLSLIRSYFASKARPMLKSNELQAELPEKAKILLNTRGTAQGMWFERDGKVCISLPGVPYEMKGIMSEFGFPEIASFFKTSSIVHKTILTQGIGESFIAEKIYDWESQLRAEGFGLAYLPSPGMVKLRISGRGGAGIDLEKRMEEKAVELENLVSDYYFGRDKDTLESIIGKLLMSKNQRIATAESCTGGYIAHLISTIPGCSEYFCGSIVAYNNFLKTEILGVNPNTIKEKNAVSREVAIEMAEGGRKITGSDYVIATTGVAGPRGGTPELPVGRIWIAIAGPNGTKTKECQFGKSRERNIRQAALEALNMLRKEIISI